jgi:DNA polymerase-3 subunit epsilon
MKAPPPEQANTRRSGFRRRTVLSFAGLAVLPMLLGLGVMFLVARHDVGRLQGEALLQDAQLLAEQIQIQIERDGQFVRALAGAPEVRAYLAGRGPYPSEVVGSARQFLDGLRQVELLALGEELDLAPGPAFASVSWGEDQTLEFTVEVQDVGGKTAGTCAARFELGNLTRMFRWVERSRGARAVLFTADGTVLADGGGAPVPPVRPDHQGWTSFEAGGDEWFAGLTPVSPGGSGVTADWFLAVNLPAGEVYGAFYRVATQVAFLLAAFAAMVTALAYKTADGFLTPILQLRHGAEIISHINLGHRIHVATGDELEDLADAFNHMAANLAGAYDDLEERVRDTTRHLQGERNRLAAVLHTMVDGVVMTNASGEVLLMNPRARLTLQSGASSGIGAPLARLLPPARLAYHYRQLRQHWDVGRDAAEDVAFPLPEGILLRGTMAAVAGPGGELAGFLLVFRIHRRNLAEGAPRRPEDVTRELPEMLRGTMTTAASLVETLERHPEMPQAKRVAFVAALQDEVAQLSAQLSLAEDAAARAKAGRWRGLVSDPRTLLEEAVAAVPGVFAQVEEVADPLPPVQVEPFSWIATLAAVLRWLAGGSTGWAPVTAAVRVEDDAVVTCFEAEGAFAGGEDQLDSLPAATTGEEPVTLGDAVRFNRGEIWTRRREGRFEVRLGLMRSTEEGTAPGKEGIADHQPEFYDFDLFLPRLARDSGEILDAPLDSLEYVVFDSETTGLQPSRGDALVSLSAVRARNGKLLTADTFHTLINPGMPIPPESIRFHGITDEMVADAPDAGQALRQFTEYVGDAVLVAHNAAFDKKFLEIVADKFRLPQLENPILDTLFLSYGIHKEFEGHNLDALAERLGIEVKGRHTSMGDALATAEIFLRLLTLLGSRDIHTLGDAKGFCDSMLLLRWQANRF